MPSSNLIFKRSSKAELRCFFDYLDIFSNEIRKTEVAFGEYEMEGMASLPTSNIRRERKNQI